MNIHKEIQRARAREGTQGVYTLFSTTFMSPQFSPTCKLSEFHTFGILWRLYHQGMIHH